MVIRLVNSDMSVGKDTNPLAKHLKFEETEYNRLDGYTGFAVKVDKSEK